MYKRCMQVSLLITTGIKIKCKPKLGHWIICILNIKLCMTTILNVINEYCVMRRVRTKYTMANVAVADDKDSNNEDGNTQCAWPPFQ